jgi:hypothetical protein
VLSPFALLGGLVGDAHGFAIARLAFMGLGALNAVLVTVLAGRFGRRAGILAGSIYVVWQIAANVERTTWLIAPQNTLLLLALVTLAPGTARGRRWAGRVPRAAIAGALLGLAFGIQIWGIVPLAVGLVWLVLDWRRDQRGGIAALAAYAVAAGAVTAAVWAPFLAVAGGALPRYVLFDQSGRPILAGPLSERIRALAALPGTRRLGPLVGMTALVAAGLLAVLAGWAAAVRPGLRRWLALLGGQLAVLFVMPPLPHYTGWLAPSPRSRSASRSTPGSNACAPRGSSPSGALPTRSASRCSSSGRSRRSGSRRTAQPSRARPRPTAA